MIPPPGFQALPITLNQLSLAAVLKCGQSFRWFTFPLSSSATPSLSTDPTHEYRLCLCDRVVCLRQSPSTLFYRAVFPNPQPSPIQSPLQDAETLEWIIDYFQLQIDLVALYEEWGKRDGVFKAIGERFVGIRMLRQDPWENLVSCVFSYYWGDILMLIEPLVSSALRTIIFRV
jgi:N-glycosylase/DNA lyase